MKFYLASRYTFRDEIKQCAKELEALGHEVTSSWLNQRTDPAVDMVKPDYRLRHFALRDWEDVARADWLLLFTREPIIHRRGGHHVEFGIALALGKLVSVIGDKENIFHYLPEVQHFLTFEEFLKQQEGTI